MFGSTKLELHWHRLGGEGLMSYRTIYQPNFWNVKLLGKSQRKGLCGTEQVALGCAYVVYRLFCARDSFSSGEASTHTSLLTRRTWIKGLAHKRLSEITSSDQYGRTNFFYWSLFFHTILQWTFEAPKVHYLTPHSGSYIPQPPFPSLNFSCTWTLWHFHVCRFIEREKEILIGCFLHMPQTGIWGSSPQPRYVPWPPSDLSEPRTMFQPTWATPARARKYF